MLLAQLIRDHRERHHLSLRAMARKIGIDYSALRRFENGRNIQQCHWSVILKWLFSS
jgi:cytoskeletal protein RodZ